MAQTIIQKEGSLLNVKPQERLDTATAPKLKEEIFPYLDGITGILMDFEQVEYISSAGLRVLLELYQNMEDRGGTFRLSHVHESILAIFDLVNFSEIFEIE